MSCRSHVPPRGCRSRRSAETASRWAMPLAVILWPMAATLAPAGAQQPAAVSEPSVEEAQEGQEGQEGEETPTGASTSTTAAQGEGSLETYPERTFRLYSRRPIGVRTRANVGARLQPREPLFSPVTADFEGRERERGPLFSIATSFSALGASGERDSAKAQELRDLSDGGAFGIDLQYRSDGSWHRLTARHLGLDDPELLLQLRASGRLSAEIDYSEIPHNYAFGAAALFSGIGSGDLVLDDDIQRDLLASTSLVDAANRLQRLVSTQSQPVDLGHERERWGLELDLTAWDPLAIQLSLRQESRTGTRPWSASLGLASVVEIPWPVDYDSGDATASIEWAHGKTLVRGSYRVSEFDNDTPNVLFDNPWRLSDSPGNFLETLSGGPARGLIDLYPDNRQEEQTLTAIRQGLPGKSNLMLTLSWGQLEQDDALVAYSTNSTLEQVPFGPSFDASDLSNRPATSAGAALETRLVHLRWTAQPVDFLELTFQLRDYDLDNETPRLFLPGFAIEDVTWRPFFGGAFSNLPIAFATTTLELELGFELAKRTHLRLGLENETIDREFREVASTDEDRFSLALDTQPAPWVDLRASYLLHERRAAGYDFDQSYAAQGIDFLPALPLLLKFDQASRDRDRLQVMASFFPTGSLIVGASVIAGEDDYPESIFGVQRDEHEVYAADLTYLLGERASLFASFGRERYRLRMAGREWIPFGAGDPFRTEPGPESASNWTAQTRDDIDTVTAGIDIALLADRLALNLAYSYSESDGWIAYDSPIGSLDANPFAPADFEEVDDVSFYDFDSRLELTLGRSAALSLGYKREKYDLLDFNSQGFELVPTTPSGELNGALFMGTFPFNYDLEVVYVELELRR